VNKRKIEFRSACPISTALDIFGDRWSLLIVRDMVFKGRNTYGDFLNGGEKIATNILADRLMLLEAGGIIIKQRHPESKAKILYTLTPKGIDLVPALVEIIAWSEKHHDVHPQAKQFVRLLRKDKEAVVGQILADLKKANKY
jgi:DNA-binding HxlR family transcriptional regulator